MKKFKEHWVEWLVRRAERTFFVYGMRRSGNHAFIDWLANALEGESVTVASSPDMARFKFSNTCRTVFINNVAGIHAASYLKGLWRYRKKLRGADFVIFSAEDRGCDYQTKWRIPDRCEPILVRRGALNIMASRYHKINKHARIGHGCHGATMDATFFDVLEKNQSTSSQTVWDFERWYSEAEWRKRFLAQLGLTHDILPSVSNEGGGSSFSGVDETPDAAQLGGRFRMVEPKAGWRRFIAGAYARHPAVFTESERQEISLIIQASASDEQRLANTTDG